MPINQRGIAHIAFLILGVLGIALGLYLVQTRTNIFPQAQQASSPPPPQTAFHLSLSSGDNAILAEPRRGAGDQAGQSFPQSWYKPGDKVVVNLAVSSDIDYSNVFNANIQYPQDLLEVASIQVEGNKVWDGGGSDGGMTEPGDATSSGGGTAGSAPTSTTTPATNRICAQVVTKACKVENVICGVGPCPPRIICREFPTPCDVPEGWSVEPIYPKPSGQVCAQVITEACRFVQTAPGCQPRNDNKAVCELIGKTECKKFPTPCDVPNGWYIPNSGRTIPPSDCSKAYCPLGLPSGCSVEQDGSCCGKIVCPSSPTPSPTPCPSGTTIIYGDPQNGGTAAIKCVPFPAPTCKPRPACLDAEPRCLMPETADMCPPAPDKVKNYFIKYWIEQTHDNATGTISLIGGMPQQGIKTATPNKPVMATIVFKAKKAGSAELKFNDSSAIIRVSDNTNILTGKNGLTIDIKEKPSVKGDIDGDGKVGSKDFSILLSKWGTNDPSVDLNGDGKVNIFDFSILLSSWTK